MKKSTAILTSALGLALGALNAQTVPPFINYQGKVTDSSGVGLGTGTPVNRKAIFRVFDAPSGGNRLWSEMHTVTISNGEFSVLLGNGIDAVYNSLTEAPTRTNTPLERVFTSAGISRYVEIVVDNGDGTLNTTDAAISPRQQITSTAYSFRARSADTITSGTDLQLNDNANYGLGYYGSTRLFNGTAVDGPVLFGQAGGALGSVSISGSKNIALRWNATGAVGIGSADLAGAASTTKLVLQGDDPNNPPLQLNIRGNSDTNKRLLLGYNTNGNYGSLQSYNGASTAAPLFLNSAGGNVGINSGAPTANLTIRTGKNGLPNTSGTAFAPSATGFRLFGADNAMLDAGVNSSGGAWFQATDQTNMATPYPLMLNPNGGNVGIGTSSPSHALTVGGNPGDSQAVNFRSFDTKSPNWKGGGAFGGSSAAVIMGESSGIAQIGGHSPTLNAWKDLLINGAGGNVGIGTGIAAPTAKLDVGGDIKSNGKSVPVAEENLRIVRGSISAGAVPFAGYGYTVVRAAVGYTVTFSTPFSSRASITFGSWTDYSPYLVGQNNSSFTVSFNIHNTNSNLDSGFDFIAVGPR